MKFILVTMSLFFAVASAQAAGLTASAKASVDGQEVNVLTDSFQRTLYVFDPDQNAGKPICNGQCAEVWPPYTVSDEEAASLPQGFSLQTRDTGLPQLAFEGRPVYTFNLDRAVGDIKGNGLGGRWHIVVLP